MCGAVVSASGTQRDIVPVRFFPLEKSLEDPLTTAIKDIFIFNVR